MRLFTNSARLGRVFTASLCWLALGVAPMCTLAQVAQQTFNFTGAVQTFTIPAGVSSLTVVANGAQGGGNLGGNGGRVTAVLSVQPRYNWVLSIYVGGRNGYNGGGAGLFNLGGGATDVRINGTALADRVVVAGGGGGAGRDSDGSGNGRGGTGGNTTGGAGTDDDRSGGGGGGKPDAGGAAGFGEDANSPGVIGIGGSGSNGGGGGGGYYGGGGGGGNQFSDTQGGAGGGGGGGSSYVNPPFLVFGTSAVHVQGVQTGDGSLTLLWQPNPLGAPTNLRLAAGPSTPYNSTSIPLTWTVNSTDEDYFSLERGRRTSASQVYTDNSLVWTAVSPNPGTNFFMDDSFTGLTANQFGYFYRVKAVSNTLGSSAYTYFVDGPLPVTLRYFNGRMTDTGALLGWATAREDNNAYFQIERSRDARSFESIGTVPSQSADGNSMTELVYTFTDAQPDRQTALPGVNYYRLSQTDRDGTRTQIGKIIALSRENQPTVLFPNPVLASGEAVLEPAITHNGYQLTDVLGRIVQRVTEPGVLSRVSLSGLPAGAYMLTIQTEAGARTFRLLR